MRTTSRALTWLLIVTLLLQSSGCSRRFFRKHTDKEVAELLKEKDDPLWSLDGFHVYPNPEARFADPSDPDRPPMPPDDPAAQCLSPNPQHPYHKSGIGAVGGVGYLERLDEWDTQNRADVAAREKARKEELEKQDADNKKPKEKGQAAGQPAPIIRVSFNTKTQDNKDVPKENEFRNPDERPGTVPGQQPSSEQILARAEELARRELAGAVTVSGPIPDKEADKKVSQQRTFLIKLEQAVELGLLNSREYQTRREQVYLAALPVTLERFAFAPQLFSAETAFYERFGRNAVGGPAKRWRLESVNGFSQLFSTGALLLLSFANRTVFNLANKPDTSVSTLSLDLVQPLLRGAGKAVTLEPLTQAERSLLYTIRDFAKFRQDFYVFIAGGQPNIQGVQIEAGRILTGSVSTAPLFVPVGAPVVRSAVPTLISPQVSPSDGATLGPVGVGVAPTQGYLSTVVEKAQLVNQYRNIQSLQRFLSLFRVYFEGSIVSSVQVGQVEQQLLRAVESGLNQQANYRNSVDQFKLQLGLPMWLRLEVADDPLQPMFDQTRRFEDLSTEFEGLYNQVQQFARVGEEDQLRGRLRRLLTTGKLVRNTRFRESIDELLLPWEKLPSGGKVDALDAKLTALGKERDALREKRERLKDEEKGDLDPKEARQLEAIEFQIELGAYERALRAYESKFWAADKDAGRRLALQNRQFNVVSRLFTSIAEEAFRERQERARKMWPDLAPLCVEGVDLLSGDDDTVIAAVSQAALTNRLDLMNQRAQVVDSWRKICIAANGLLGTFNVQYHFDTSTPEGRFRPFSLGGNRNRHQLIFDTELPLVRIAQRNAYRSTLIAYQRQRRALQQAEDEVLFGVRSEVRQLRATAYSYQNVQKRAFELAYLQVDQALQAFSQPQAPSGPASPPGSVGAPVETRGGGDPAALTNQLLQNQNSLLQAQNALYNTWIGYLILRMSLYRDMGLMQLDPRGVWIDDVATCHCPQSSTTAADGKPGSERPANLPQPYELKLSDPPNELPAPKPLAPAKK